MQNSLFKFYLLLCLFLLPSLVRANDEKIEYKIDIGFQNLDYVFSRDSHPINDQLEAQLSGGFLYDNGEFFLINIKPLVYFDALDFNRNRYIPNDAYLKFYNDFFEFTAGYQVVSWGVSRSFNPTDVINRPDLERNYYRPSKLGDPLIGAKFSIPKIGILSQVNINLLALPVFLETPLPESDSRYALEGVTGGAAFSVIEDQEHPAYPNSMAGAIEFSATIKSTDLALEFYHGPERNPGFYLRLDDNLNVRAQPFYYTIDMVGLNFETVVGQFTFHGEVAYKFTDLNDPKLHELPLASVSDAIPNSYLQYVPGIDYTIDGVFKTGTLVLIGEYLGEDHHTTIFEEFRPLKNDVFVGGRFLLNDIRSTQIDFGLVKDLSNSEMITYFEGGTNIYKDLRITVGGMVINQSSNPDSPLSFFDNNTYFYSRLSYSWGGRVK